MVRIILLGTNRTSHTYTDLGSCYCNCIRVNESKFKKQCSTEKSPEGKKKKISIQYEDEKECYYEPEPVKKADESCMCSFHVMYIKTIDTPEPELKKYLFHYLVYKQIL